MENFEIVEKAPHVDDYLKIREKVGLRFIDKNLAKQGLRHSLFAVSVYNGEELVAMGRVVGDMGIAFYLQDVIVLGEYQNKGLGTKIVKRLEKYVEGFRIENTEIFLGLMATKGKEEFYEKLGFKYSHRIKNFFIDNYNHPIYECGIQLRDIIYLKREF